MLKKIITAILAICLISSYTTVALGFTFPTPDWGALYHEKERMVTETDFELYAESSVESAPYYGEELEPRGGAYIGSVVENADKIMPLSCYFTNIDEMNASDLYYPANVRVKSDNVVTMVGWTIYDLNNVNYDHVRTVLNNLNAYNKPMFIRFANEMNCSNLGDDPDKYIEVFRNVANMVHEYPNFAVVWSPNDLGALDRPFEYFYPGDEYVDWVGVSNYMVKYFQGNPNTQYKDSVYFMSGDYSWATNKVKPVMEFMAKNNINKPVMISEGGVATSNSYGEDCQYWNTPRLRNMLWYLVMKYPQIKMINYFDVRRNDEVEKFDISSYPYAVDIFNEAKNSGAYIREYGSSSDFVFQPANYAGTLVADNGIIPLYTLAYIANQQDLTVNYEIDGNWYHCSSEIPYRCNMDISSISDGAHTLRISASNEAKEYTFYKSGNCIAFGGQPDANIMAQNQTQISVVVNGTKLEFDQAPVLQNDRTLVPLRAIFEALSAEVNWDDATQTVTAKKADTNISLKIDDTKMYVNGKVITLEVPAQLINDRTMVPVRAVSEALSADVNWDDATQTVIINS